MVLGTGIDNEGDKDHETTVTSRRVWEPRCLQLRE